MDPTIISLKDDLAAKSATVKIYQSRKDFKVTGDLLAGIEDVTDNTSGAAVVLKANRLLFDGGKLEAEILREQLGFESAQYALLAKLDQRSLELASLWVDLDRYYQLNNLIDSRLSVLEPLIRQLDEVAKAGIGDVSQVAAAQRTVSSVRVTKADVSEKLSSSKLRFKNAFGAIPNDIAFDAKFVSDLVPSKIGTELAFESPALQSDFLNYRSAEANLIAVGLKDSHNIGFEARASRPMGNSEYDSDESIGIVLRKTLFNGNVVDFEVQQAQALVNSAAAKLEATFKDGERIIKTSQQKIVSLKKASELARENASVTLDEIDYLKQQLIIGGSTLEAFKASLYQAESQINLKTELHKAELAHGLVFYRHLWVLTYKCKISRLLNSK